MEWLWLWFGSIGLILYMLMASYQRYRIFKLQVIIIKNQFTLGEAIDILAGNQIALAKTIPFKKVIVNGERVK